MIAKERPGALFVYPDVVLSSGSLPASRELRRQDSPRSKARRAASRAALEIRADPQYESREGARAAYSAVSATAGRNGDRMTDRRAVRPADPIARPPCRRG